MKVSNREGNYLNCVSTQHNSQLKEFVAANWKMVIVMTMLFAELALMDEHS